MWDRRVEIYCKHDTEYVENRDRVEAKTHEKRQYRAVKGFCAL